MLFALRRAYKQELWKELYVYSFYFDTKFNPGAVPRIKTKGLLKLIVTFMTR